MTGVRGIKASLSYGLQRYACGPGYLAVIHTRSKSVRSGLKVHRR